MTSPDAAPSPAWPLVHSAVLADAALLGRLLATSDAAAFRATALTVAAERGIALAPAELDAGIANARQAWLLRHVCP